ncbi:hypothetical protein SAMN02745704_02644 [Paucidesulfovibrio gracilis DSM 16080]|uniref:Uncharacterized protein n=1 Tax=Paucidesulfovibrio gracilis DSM 16080 TaxID=1121449 RepID=A0A1T4Y010_9BACT|nr:hypothetical protein [Paucidesulfovibrio gracilis]SKA95120.1 hypothetical protein SAMN02745704_02644 [Paucidesulfovibrio gracilis DSM 16080]
MAAATQTTASRNCSLRSRNGTAFSNGETIRPRPAKQGTRSPWFGMRPWFYGTLLILSALLFLFTPNGNAKSIHGTTARHSTENDLRGLLN